MTDNMEPLGISEEAVRVFRRLEEEVYRLNISKGWFDSERSVGDMVALLHAEASEVLEAFREWDMKDATRTGMYVGSGEIVKPEGVGAEIADCFIRILDMCKRWDIDLAAEYKRKMEYNWTRPYRHGRKNL